MINSRGSLAFALIQDVWQFWKTFGDIEIKTEQDWTAVMDRAEEITDKYAMTSVQSVSDTFVKAVFEWLEDKSRGEVTI